MEYTKVIPGYLERHLGLLGHPRQHVAAKSSKQQEEPVDDLEMLQMKANVLHMIHSEGGM